MPRNAAAIRDAEEWNELPSKVRPQNALATPEEMQHRERVIARIQARMVKPASEADKRLWEKFIAELERERPTFRS